MYQNMFAFMAIVIGIGNQAVSRLSSTWEKLPAKYRKLMQEFETILVREMMHFFHYVFFTANILTRRCSCKSKTVKGYS